MRIDVLTLFPEMFEGPLRASILGRALREGVAEVRLHNIRDYATDKHQVVDDDAYGGGPGMVMKPEPLVDCIEAVRAEAEPAGRVVLLTPQGRPFNQALVHELSEEPGLILVCGHYEGVDQRMRGVGGLRGDHGRLCAVGRGDRGDGARRCGGAAVAGGLGTGEAVRRILFRRGWNIRSTRGRRSFGDGTSRRCWCTGTTARSRAGDAGSGSYAQRNEGQTCYE